MNNLTYQFVVSTGESVDIRAIQGQEDSLWFVLRDVLDAMESTTRPSDAVESISQGLGGGVVIDYPIIDSLGRTQQATIVHESGVTYLISRSNTEAGRKLNKFLHFTVLPSIRKTGKFSQEPTIREPKDPALAAIFRMLLTVDEVKQKVETVETKQDHLQRELEDVKLQHRGNVPPGHIGKKDAFDKYGVYQGQALSEEIFHTALRVTKVPTKDYTSISNEGFETRTFAYREDQILDALDRFIADAVRVNKSQCASPMAGMKRFRFVKPL